MLSDEAPAAGGNSRLELTEILFTAIFIPIAAFSWVGISLAELGAFNGWRVTLGGAVVCAVAFSAAFRDLRASAQTAPPVSPLRWCLLGLVLAGAAVLFSPPGEYLIEGVDGSVYLATGRQIDRTGGITADDPIVSLMPGELRSTFLVVGRQARQQEARFPGGLLIGPDGKVHPSFFHLLPVWIAIATAGAGPSGGYFVNVVLAVLGVFLVGLIGRRLWSPAAGLVAATLLVVNFGQIYHARLPSSEMLAQFLGLSTIFFTLLAWDHRSRVSGACAGAAAGLAAFTRVDTFLLIVLPVIAWLVLTRRDESLRQARRWYAGILGLLAVHAFVHAATVAQLYISRLGRDGWPRLLRVLTHFGAVTTIVLIVTLVAGAVLILKYRGRSLIFVGICAALALAVLPTRMIVMLNLLLTPVGLAAAVAGLALVFVTRWDARVLTLVVPLTLQTGLLLVWTETILLPADFRRAIPLMLPGITLLIGFLVARLGSGPNRIARVLWLLPIGLGARFAMDSAPILRTPAMQGVEPQVAAIARELPANAVVILDGSVPGHLPLALQYDFDRPSVRLFDRPPDNVEIAPLVTAALKEGRPVFAAVEPMPPTAEKRPERIWRSDFAGFDIEYQKTMPLRYTFLAPIRASFPRTFRTDDLPVAIYRVSQRDDAPKPLPFLLDIGADDFRALVDGFHAAEQIQSSSARWTNGDSRIALPRLAAPSSGILTLVLRASADRPQGQAPAVLNLTIDGIPAGTPPPLTPSLTEYRIVLPAEARARVLAGPTLLSLTSGFFIPNAAGLNGDSRRLGIVIDWVRIE